MLGLGPYAVYILATYVISAITLLLLTTWIVLAEKRQISELEKLDEVKRTNSS